MKKLFLTLTVYSAIAFGLCILISNVMGNIDGNLPALVPIAVKNYKFTRGFIWFLEVLPAIILSGVVVGACIQWKNGGGMTSEKSFSESMWRRYRKLFVVGLLLSLFLTVSHELFIPGLERKQNRHRENPELLERSLELSQNLLEKGNGVLAAQYAQIAYGINPLDSRALKLYKDTHENLESTLQALEEERQAVEAEEAAIQTLSENVTASEVQSYNSQVEEIQEEAKKAREEEEALRKSEQLSVSKDEDFLFSFDEPVAPAGAEQLESEEELPVKLEPPVLTHDKGYSSKELIELSKKASDEERWFDAHYWATLAMQASRETDTNYKIAVDAANEAWAKMSTPSGFDTEEQNRYYRLKKKGYSALNSGDFLTAYYIFESLFNLDEEKSKDPDVIRYLALSKEQLENQYFFIDETSLMQQMDLHYGIYFELPDSLGGKRVYSIGAMASTRKDGGYVRYLQDFSYVEFDEEGNYVCTCYVPFAKVVPVPVNTFTEEQIKLLGLDPKWKTIPEIYLQSVDRKTQGVASLPVYEKSSSGMSIQKEALILLPMAYSEFDMLETVAQGPGDMGISALYKFCQSKKDFGFSKNIYIQSFVSRCTYPLLILVLILLCGCAAWNYGFADEKSLFKFKYIFAMPLLFAVYFVLLEVIVYSFTLLNFVLTGAAGFMALLISIGIYVALLVAVSIVFVSRKKVTNT